MARLACGIALPATLVLHGPWGSGKTVFIKQWRWLVDKDPYNARVIYFDAFAHDFRQDPFVALTCEFAKKSATPDKIKKAAKEMGKSIFPRLAGAGADILTAGILGKSVEALVEEQFSERDEAEERLKEFRAELETSAKPDEGKGPLIFIIDELDRCRPDFALACLELIKHVFAVPGICFVLVTNLDHLAGVVRGRYGAEMDGATYLQKFYDVALTLPQQRPDDSTDYLSRYANHLWSVMGLNERFPQNPQGGVPDILRIARLHACSLRDLEHIAAYYALFIETLRCAGADDFETEVVAGLCLMRVIRPPLFQKAADGRLSEEDVRAFFHFNDPQWDDRDRFKYIWLYVTAEDPGDEVFERIPAPKRPLDQRRSTLLTPAKQMMNFRIGD